MAWSVQDLAEITHLLIAKLSEAIKQSPRYVQNQFQFEVSGLMPGVSRTDGTNVLSLYLLHVGRDPYWRNTPVQGMKAQTSTKQPLSLNLSYLMTSYSEKNWHMEQYLMSVALQYFHANPIYISPTAEFTVTVEADSIEEMSRLWQAIMAPIRLSSMFRVAVVFLTPEVTPDPDKPMPVEVALSVAPDLGYVSPVPEPEPALIEVAVQVGFRVPPIVIEEVYPAPGSGLAAPLNPADPAVLAQIGTVTGPVASVAGGTVRVRGTALDGLDAQAVYLRNANGSLEWPITNWRVAATSPSAGNPNELVVLLPTAYAATPATGTNLVDLPPPGNYQIAVGNATTSARSNALPLTIGPLMLGIGTAPAVLTPVPAPVGVYSFSASGLVAGATSIWLGTTELPVAATVGPGKATVDAIGGQVTFEAPATGFVSGANVPVRVIVNGIEAPPGWWIVIP
jgi:hypothetical protein